MNKQIAETPHPRDHYFISIGAGNNQLPLIQAAREQGIPVIVVDRNLQAPGFQYADIQLQCSIKKPGRIIRMIQENLTHGQVVGAGGRSYGAATLSTAHVARAFGAPGLTTDSVKILYNKRKLKESLKKSGIALPRSFTWDRESEPDSLSQASLPLVVRPVSGHGKMGVRLIRSPEERERFLEEFPRDTHRFLVEEFVEGHEVTVLGFVNQGIFHTVVITDKIVSREPPLFAEILHRYPSSLTHDQQEQIRSSMQILVNRTGMETGPCVAEFILGEKNKKGEEKFYLVEAAPEVGGEYLADRLVPAAYRTDYFQDLLQLYLGKNRFSSIEEAGRLPRRKVLIRFLLQREGTLKKLSLPDALREHPDFLFSRYLKKPGDYTSVHRGNLDRLAVFALAGPMERSTQLEEDLNRFVEASVVQYE